ncbi:MAG: radical SAM protein [Phycisphaeraceae bacterium]|nr:radical SAM protein [Phycisphaeraceae bacterium]
MNQDTVSVYLIKPSKYDDDGFVLRHWKSSLPSNTLACMNALTEQAASSGELGARRVKTVTIDEAIEKVPVNRIIARSRRRTVVCALIGVQTNQFPRAADLARTLHRGGARVVIGGFHVSGVFSLTANIPREVQELVDAGITVVMGEAEQAWGRILADLCQGTSKGVYNLLEDKPDLGRAPIPFLSRRLRKRYAFPNMGTVDAGRGCPFRCDFCTIINVQGHAMRTRCPTAIGRAIRRYHDQGVTFYFFTDDNFCRNPRWREIFDELARLRTEQGVQIEFMMQVDTQSHRIDGFVERAAAAGCTQVFIGLESVNAENLKSAGKPQNRVGEYRALIDAWSAHHVATHAGYILGFPGDTYESIMRDVETLKQQVRVDRVSFFILTPLPGSVTHLRMVEAGKPTDEDFNRYDTFHVVTDHESMSRSQWERAYRDAWTRFFCFDHMKSVLKRSSRQTYWGHMVQFMWYRNSMLHGEHPMLSGMFRFKDRGTRRPGSPRTGRCEHLAMRARDTFRTFGIWCRLLRELEALWLETRRPEFDHITTLGRFEINWTDLWLDLRRFRFGRFLGQPARKLIAETLWFQHMLGRLALRWRCHRQDLDAKWRQLADAFARRRLALRHLPVATVTTLREIPLLVGFGSTFLLKSLIETPTPARPSR